MDSSCKAQQHWEKWPCVIASIKKERPATCLPASRDGWGGAQCGSQEPSPAYRLNLLKPARFCKLSKFTNKTLS